MSTMSHVDGRCPRGMRRGRPPVRVAGGPRRTGRRGGGVRKRTLFTPEPYTPGSTTRSTAHTDSLRGFWLMRAHNHTHIDHSGTETDRTRIYYVEWERIKSRSPRSPATLTSILCPRYHCFVSESAPLLTAGGESYWPTSTKRSSG